MRGWTFWLWVAMAAADLIYAAMSIWLDKKYAALGGLIGFVGCLLLATRAYVVGMQPK